MRRAPKNISSFAASHVTKIQLLAREEEEEKAEHVICYRLLPSWSTMSTSVNIGDDIKSYLSKSKKAGAGVSKLFNGSGAKGWLYSPLVTADSDDVSGNVQVTTTKPKSSYLGSWFGRSEPEPDNSYLPSLVS